MVRGSRVLCYDVRMFRLLKRLRTTITLLLILIILGAAGFTAFRLGTGASPEDLKSDVATGVSWVREDEGAVTRFVRRALRPVANPGDTLKAVKQGVGDMRREVAQWTRTQRRQLTDGRELIKGMAEQNRQPTGSVQSLFTTAQTFLGASRTPEVPSTSAIRVYFSPPAGTGTPMVESLLDDMASAETSIDCACFEFSHPRLAAALAERHAAGVPVRLVTDSDYADNEAIELLRTAGVPVVLDDRSAYMHDKFCVFDGERVWTGSANFSVGSFEKSFNDMIEIASPELASNYTTEFTEMFTQHSFGVRSPADTPNPRLVIDGVSVETYFAPEDRVQNEIIAEIAEAERRIDFMMFSFTSEPLSEALLMRMLDGVYVRGIMEKSQAGQEASRDEFLALRGAEIYIDENADTFHHKAIIIDEQTVITGSYNYSASAERENDENVLIIESPELAKRYLEVMQTLIQP